MSDERHPIICYDLDLLQRFFRTVAAAVTLARRMASPDDGRPVIPVRPVLFFWEETNAADDLAVPRDFRADVDELHRRLLSGWIDELARSGPKAAARHVALARSQRGSAHATILSAGRPGRGGDVLSAIAALDRFAPGGGVGITAFPAHAGVVHGAGAATGLAVTAIEAPAVAEDEAMGFLEDAMSASFGRTGPTMPEGAEPVGARAGHEEEPCGGRLGFQHVPTALATMGGPHGAGADARPFALAWEEGGSAIAAAIHVSGVTGTGGTTGAETGAAAEAAVFGVQGAGASTRLGHRAFAEAERARLVLAACDDQIRRHATARGHEAMMRRARHGDAEILRRTAGEAGPAARGAGPFPISCPEPGPQMPVVWVGWDLIDRVRAGAAAMADAR